METNFSLKIQTQDNQSYVILADVIGLDEYKEGRIERTLNSITTLKGRTARILVKELFSPFCRAAVLLRKRDGSYECF